MIKECKVLMWNECVMVIDFDGNKIQMPRTPKNEKVVFVKLEKNIYSLVSEDEYKKSLVKYIKKETKIENEE